MNKPIQDASEVTGIVPAGILPIGKVQGKPDREKAIRAIVVKNLTEFRTSDGLIEVKIKKIIDQILALFPDEELRITFPDSKTANKWLQQNEEEIRKQEQQKIISFIDWLDNGTRSCGAWCFEIRKYKQALEGEK